MKVAIFSREVDTLVSDVSEPGTVAWSELLTETIQRLAKGPAPAQAASEARWIIAEASGFEGAELVSSMAEPATTRGVASLDRMVARRLEGEPLQYVLGRWGFRTLDLALDARVLIPRPETEYVVDFALEVLDRSRGEGPGRALDLGVGSGAIALSLAVERPGVEVWGVERSPAALALAQSNASGLGRAGLHVRLVEGSWFEPLPRELLGTFDLVISNPPYVAESETLDPVVVDHEPAMALRATDGAVPGSADVELVLTEAFDWLKPGGAVVVEMAPPQVGPMAALAERLGYVDVMSQQDLAGRDRMVIACRS